jgi:prevent-host-death family protein
MRSSQLDYVLHIIRLLMMKSTYSIKDAQSQFPSLVREAEQGGMATITRHEKAVAYVLGAEDLAALIETAEILANPAAMKAIAVAESGKGRVYSVEDLGE